MVEILLGVFDLFPNVSTSPDLLGIAKEDWGKGIQLATSPVFLSTALTGSPFGAAASGTSGSAPHASSPSSSPFENGLSPALGQFYNRSTPSLPLASPGLGAAGLPSAFSLAKSLLMGPPDAKAEAMVDFMNTTRRPRVFKQLMKELSGVIMDYFWCVRAHTDKGCSAETPASGSSAIRTINSGMSRSSTRTKLKLQRCRAV